MRCDQHLQLSDQLAAGADDEVDLDPLLERVEPHLLEPDNVLGDRRLVLDIGERSSTPQR
jgi:hypothetical protein